MPESTSQRPAPSSYDRRSGSPPAPSESFDPGARSEPPVSPSLTTPPALLAPPVAELLKYPLVVVTIFVALVGARFLLGIDFANIASIGSDGVRFHERADTVNAAVLRLETQLNEMRVAVEHLRRAGTPAAAEARADSVEARQVEALQTVTDAQAVLSVSTRSTRDGDRRSLLAGTDGYIWIGDYERSAWRRSMLVTADDRRPGPPDEIVPGTTYRVTGNMVVRDSLPPDDADYFLARPRLGAIPSGTRVEVRATPSAIKRAYATQYWMRVRILD